VVQSLAVRRRRQAEAGSTGFTGQIGIDANDMLNLGAQRASSCIDVITRVIDRHMAAKASRSNAATINTSAWAACTNTATTDVGAARTERRAGHMGSVRESSERRKRNKRARMTGPATVMVGLRVGLKTKPRSGITARYVNEHNARRMITGTSLDSKLGGVDGK
ncbi:hypothetical protein J2R62_17645, partial [Plesiomonas shigelloides]